MTTPAEIFRPNEIVHVIDESISRWTKAKIIGIVSDWSVKIKWMGYTSIYPSEIIEVWLIEIIEVLINVYTKTVYNGLFLFFRYQRRNAETSRYGTFERL